MADPQSVFPRFFATLGAPPLRGREFDSRDTTTSPKVVLVNETFAREFLGGADPVGRGIGLHSTQQADATIVGLVRNMHHDGVRRNPVPVVYLPATQDDPGFARMFVVKSALPPSELGSTVRHLAAELSSEAALTHVQTLGERVDGSILRDRLWAG